MEYEIPFYPDPASLEPLAPDTQRRILDARAKLLEILADNSELEVAKGPAYAAATRYNSSLRLLQGAAGDYTVFERSVGPQAIAPSRQSEWTMLSLLVASGLVEGYLGFNGLRFALGQIGYVRYPWEDPLSLTGSMVIGAMSVLSAHHAGKSFSSTERSVMHEPVPAEISLDSEVPETVKADPVNGTGLFENSTLVGTTQTFDEDPLPDLFELEPTEPVPPSPEVLAEEARAEEALAADADNAKIKRYLPVLRAPRSQGLSRKIGIALVSVTLGLWTVNGVLRGGYLARLPTPGAAVSTGIFGSQVATPKPPAGLSHLETTVAITLLSWFFYLLAVGVVFAQSTPAQQRGKDLRKRVKDAEKALNETLDAIEDVIRNYQKRRYAPEIARLKARNAEATARIVEDRVDFSGLEGT